MFSLKNRSFEKEQLDGDNIPFQDIVLNMKELDFINTFLGGHKISIAGFKEFVGLATKFTICEVGCGGGDNMRAIQRYATKNNIDISSNGNKYSP